MKAAIALNGMFLCKDAELLCVMNRILDDLAIDTTLCMDDAHAIKTVSERVLDCAILEWAVRGPQVMQQLRASDLNQECFVVALVNSSDEMKSAFDTGAAIVMQKPGTTEHALRCMRAAYGTMIRQRRTAFRALVKIPVEARNGPLCFSAVIVDLSHSGMCLHTEANLKVRDCVRVDFTLPGTEQHIHSIGVIVWVKHNRAGVKFSSIPPHDFVLLKSHLDQVQKQLGVSNIVVLTEPQPPISTLLDELAGLQD